MPSEMPSGEYRIEQPKAAERRLTEIVGRLKQKAKLDHAIRELRYEQAIDTLAVGLERGEDWAVDRLDALESAVEGYVTANNVRRMDALMELKDQLEAVLSDFSARGGSALGGEQRGKKAA